MRLSLEENHWICCLLYVYDVSIQYTYIVLSDMTLPVYLLNKNQVQQLSIKNNKNYHVITIIMGILAAPPKATPPQK